MAQVKAPRNGTAKEQRAAAAPPKHKYPLPVRRLHDAFRKHEAEAIDKLNLANAYIRDGAYMSGAKVLRAAADEFEKSQIARNDALTIMSKKPE